MYGSPWHTGDCLLVPVHLATATAFRWDHLTSTLTLIIPAPGWSGSESGDLSSCRLDLQAARAEERRRWKAGRVRSRQGRCPRIDRTSVLSCSLLSDLCHLLFFALSSPSHNEGKVSKLRSPPTFPLLLPPARPAHLFIIHRSHNCKRLVRPN